MSGPVELTEEQLDDLVTCFYEDQRAAIEIDNRSNGEYYFHWLYDVHQKLQIYLTADSYTRLRNRIIGSGIEVYPE